MSKIPASVSFYDISNAKAVGLCLKDSEIYDIVHDNVTGTVVSIKPNKGVVPPWPWKEGEYWGLNVWEVLRDFSHYIPPIATNVLEGHQFVPEYWNYSCTGDLSGCCGCFKPYNQHDSSFQKIKYKQCECSGCREPFTDCTVEE